MHRQNFQELALIKSNMDLRALGSFIQDLENQLWDGHPHIYPNLRIFLEDWCDLIIDVGIGLKIREEYNGKTRKEIHEYYDDLISQKKLLKSLCGHELVVAKHQWTFALKIRTVECAFLEKGVNTRNWAFSSEDANRDDNLKDLLNDRAHVYTPISCEQEKAYGQFEARFGVLKIIHDGVYKDFLEKVLNIPVAPYLMPDKAEIIGIVNEFYESQNAYK